MNVTRAVVLFVTAVLATGCQTASDRDAAPAADVVDAPVTRPSVEGRPAADRGRAPMSQVELRPFVLAREDFPYEWVSTPPDTADDPSVEAAERDYEACLGLELGTLEPVVELESDDFTLDGSFEVASSVTQYRSASAARADFDAMRTISGRECYRQTIRSLLADEMPPEVVLRDVLVVECDAIEDVSVETACVTIDVFVTGGAIGDAGMSIVYQMNGFLREDLLTVMGVRWSSTTTIDDASLVAIAQAAYALADRVAAVSID